MTMTQTKLTDCLFFCLFSFSVCLSVCLSFFSLSVCPCVCLIRLVDRVERSLFSMPIRQAATAIAVLRLSLFLSLSLSLSAAPSEMQNQLVQQQEAAEKVLIFCLVPALPNSLSHVVITTKIASKQRACWFNRVNLSPSLSFSLFLSLLLPPLLYQSLVEVTNLQFVVAFSGTN